MSGPALPLVVPSGSGALFAGTRRVEQRASTAALDPRVPLRLEKGEPHGYHRGSLLQIVSRRQRDRLRAKRIPWSQSWLATPHTS